MQNQNNLMHDAQISPTSHAMKIVSLNIGRAQVWTIDGRRVMSAIAKRPVGTRLAVGVTGLAGDEQADPSVHGGLSKAVYAYPLQHYAFWRTVRAQAPVAAADDALIHGALGENLTVEGVQESGLWVGDQYVGPDCTLVVSEPRLPCFKFGAAMGFAQAVRLMVQSGWCGAYFAVLQPGTLGAGDTLTCKPGPREVSVAELFRARARA